MRFGYFLPLLVVGLSLPVSAQSPSDSVAASDSTSTVLRGVELERRDITHIAADYWISFRVVFESDREIIAAPVGTDRYPPYTEEVTASDREARRREAASNDASSSAS